MILSLFIGKPELIKEGRVLSQLKEDYSDSGERLVTRMALWLNV